jgi:hypothetical protein
MIRGLTTFLLLDLKVSFIFLINVNLIYSREKREAVFIFDHI